MKIRSITLGTPALPSAAAAIERWGTALERLAAGFAAAGFEVQTTRVALPPLLEMIGQADLGRLARAVDAAAGSAGVGYVALGPLRWTDPDLAADLAADLPAALAANSRVFGSIETVRGRRLDYRAVAAAASVVRQLADGTAGGFGNFQFAALANCPPGIPFFPAAYHETGEAVFGLALQAADLAVATFRRAATLDQAEAELTEVLTRELLRIERVALELEAELGLRYAGADPTLAPFPDDAESIGAALELLGVGVFGRAGTLTGAALVTRAVRAAGGRRCGYAGLMLPVLEDSILARRSAERQYGWEELLLWSAVCGLGLDTVPLPGDIGQEELASIISDVSTLAATLDKPLTCRLFPVPGRQAGELTSFESPYIANAGVLPGGGGGSPDLLRRGLSGSRV